VGEPLVLRTSGLLSRSNKLMYDLVSGSAFHTFTGRAASGPLREAAVTLEPVTVTVATWGDWKEAHPDTTIVARDGGIGRSYPDDPLCGRDAAGPIFPIGPADTRLPAQAAVVGVVDGAGAPVAFAAELARSELAPAEPSDLRGRGACRRRRWRRSQGCRRAGARDPRGVLVRLEPVPPHDRTVGTTDARTRCPGCRRAHGGLGRRMPGAARRARPLIPDVARGTSIAR
jgi:hypothetical protein